MASFVQYTGGVQTGGTSSNTIVLTVTNAPASGNTLIGAVKTSGGAAINTIVDSRSNTWTTDVDSANANSRNFIVRAVMTTPLLAGDTITITIAASNANNEFMVNEYTGLLTPSPFDVGGKGSGAAAITGSATMSGATTASNELYITTMATGTNTTYTVPTGYTSRPSSFASYRTNMAELNNQASGQTPTVTWNWTGSFVWAVCIAAYKPTVVSTSRQTLTMLGVGS